MTSPGGRIRWFARYDIVVAAYFAVSLLLSLRFGFHIDYRVAIDLRYDIPFLKILGLVFLAALPVTAARSRILGDDDRWFGRKWRAMVRQSWLTSQRLWDLIHVLVLMKLVLTIYTSVKQAIPRISPTGCDAALERIDTLLHFGNNPVDLVLSVFGNPSTIGVLDQLYVGWYLIKAPVLAIFILVPDRRFHLRFFEAYFLMWIICGLTAAVLPSYGPVYIHPQWFDHVAKPYATGLQQQLWTHYQQMLANPDQYRAFVYEGIAAFPSLHVGAVALFTVFLWRLHRGLGVVMGLYTVTVLIGSVTLGWHYAIDGYVTILLAFGLDRIVWYGPRRPTDRSGDRTDHADGDPTG